MTFMFQNVHIILVDILKHDFSDFITFFLSLSFYSLDVYIFSLSQAFFKQGIEPEIPLA